MTPSLFREIDIRELNIAFRRAGPLMGRHLFDGLWLFSHGVQGQGPCFVWSCLWMAMAPEKFPAEDDPRGAHETGSFEVGAQRVVWAIDYVQRGTQFPAKDAADCAGACRIITIMLEGEE